MSREGIVKSYLISRIETRLFALIPSTVSCYLSFGLKLLLLTLRKIPEASITWPKGAEFEENRDLVTVRHAMLDGAFGVMDGLKLPVQTSSDEETENATYPRVRPVVSRHAEQFRRRLMHHARTSPK